MSKSTQNCTKLGVSENTLKERSEEIQKKISNRSSVARRSQKAPINFGIKDFFTSSRI